MVMVMANPTHFTSGYMFDVNVLYNHAARSCHSCVFAFAFVCLPFTFFVQCSRCECAFGTHTSVPCTPHTGHHTFKAANIYMSCSHCEYSTLHATHI